MLQPNIRMSLRARRRCFRGLVKICGEHGILPDSYIVSESEIRKLGSSPIPSGGSSEVWAGMYGEDKPVAIKVIRFYVSGDARKVKKVRLYDLFSSRQSLTVRRTFAGRS